MAGETETIPPEDRLCSSCRWWAQKSTWDDNGDCERINSGAGNKAKETSARIYPTQSGAYLQTAPNFGCRLWELEIEED